MDEIVKICKVHGELRKYQCRPYYCAPREKTYYKCDQCLTDYSKNWWIKLKSSRPPKKGRGEEVKICEKHNIKKIYRRNLKLKKGSYECKECKKEYCKEPNVIKRRNELEKIRRLKNRDKFLLRSKKSKEKYKEKHLHKNRERSRNAKKIHIHTLPDSLVIDRLIYRTSLKRKDFPKPLIGLKRIVILLNKEIRKRRKNEPKQN